MNLTVLLIAAYLPLPVILFMVLRSGSFGRGSLGTLLKLFFLGVLAAVPAFLMEAGCLLALEVLLRIIPEGAFGGSRLLVTTILRYALAVALIEEAWKHFILRASTWKQMMMETVGDGIAAAALVGAGFSTVLYGAWLAASRVVPADMEALRGAMPDYLRAGAVISFLYALGFLFSHFGFSGLMGMFYSVAKGSEQKEHGHRAGFMLFVSCLLPVLVHGLLAVLIGYGIAAEKIWWFAVGFAAQVVLALLMASVLSHSADDAFAAREREREERDDPDLPVDFADSEDFASFAESAGEAGGSLHGDHDLTGRGHDGRGDRRESFSMPLVGPDTQGAGGYGAGASEEPDLQDFGGYGDNGSAGQTHGEAADGNADPADTSSCSFGDHGESGIVDGRWEDPESGREPFSDLQEADDIPEEGMTGEAENAGGWKGILSGRSFFREKDSL